MKYEIRKNVREISYKNRMQIKQGCTLEQNNQDPEVIKSFDDKDEALNELKSYNSDICKLSGGAGAYYAVTEYYVEENEYDEDGEWVSGGDVWEFSEIKIELVEKPSYETLGVYSDMESAENALNDYERENEVYLSF
ncbi:hypothetical protein [uncultured Acetatifactor sp.]|uniref:hypothetical protein n=1 Tax=uncultured Acetatifactor sp. TaxID=1671927 RepID=UPI00262ABA77|nr:hypothetical protein [uncultured Acetatifactor sp.]